MTVVVAVVGHRIVEMDAWQLIAGPPCAGHIGQGQLGHLPGVGGAVGQHRMEGGNGLVENRVGVTVGRIEAGA